MSGTFHPHIHKAYRETKEWLDNRRPKLSYRSLSYKQITKLLHEDEHTLQNAAAQFHTYFPAHHYKAIEVLHNALSLKTLVSWLKHNPRICILDIGCGAGAGSSGFIESILVLQEQRVITQNVDVFCIGIDPNPYAVTLYSHFLKNLQTTIIDSGAYKLTFTHKIINDGFPSATSQIITALKNQHELWDQPHFAHCVILQINVVSPLQNLFARRTENRRLLIEMGVELDSLPQDDDEFGLNECSAYRSIFESVLIDNLHVFTISTDNYMLAERVGEMGKALDRVFSDRRHRVELLTEGEHSVSYYNPKDSYWAYNPNLQKSKFHVNITSISNDDLRTDQDWQEVISEDNLRLAWVRARQELLGESFIDEIGIRIFEIKLEDNLKRMQQQLVVYADDLAKKDDYIAYKIPKSLGAARPLGISHFEEELLSIAIIQKLGKKESQLRGSSYAYQISSSSYGRQTEYLYKPWFEAYKLFIYGARLEGEKQSTGAVIRIDIRSFFTNILQNQLIEMTQKTLSHSQRIHWLIKLLLSKNLDEHELGRGIVQGSPGSGFYANIYLTPIDVRFGADNEWKAKIFRFVDDIILVVPEQEDEKSIETSVKEILEAVESELLKLQLELNTEKTVVYYNIAEFLLVTEPDILLENLSESYFSLINSLWLLDQGTLTLFRPVSENKELWWFNITLYCKFLQSIGIYTTPTYVSRQIAKYLYNVRKRNKELRKSNELSIPYFMINGCEVGSNIWHSSFVRANGNWIQRVEDMHKQLAVTLHDSWALLKNNNTLDPSKAKQLQTRVRFVVNRLTLLGFSAVIEPLMDILTNSPWVIRDVIHPLETLAYQGFITEIKGLIYCYAGQRTIFSTYLRACLLRSVRFLPSVDDETWSQIVNYGLHGSVIERLMATESWLYLRHTDAFYKQVTATSVIAQYLLNYEELSRRLVRNYYILWKCYSETQSLDSTGIPDLSEIIGEEYSDIFEYQEPDIIREVYYSSQQQGDNIYY